jgi:hypothetical protein
LRVQVRPITHGGGEREAGGVSKDALELFEIQMADGREVKRSTSGRGG